MAPEPPKLKKKPKPWLRDWTETILIAFVLALVIRAFIVQVFFIPTGSMEPTFYGGDRIVVNKFAYGIQNPYYKAHEAEKFLWIFPNPFYGRHSSFFDVKYFWKFKKEPKRFNILVFKYPAQPGEPQRDFIKRAIGLPGDKLEFKKGLLYINGKPLAEPHPMNWDEANFGPIQVPPGHYFMMGDNRPASADSRYWGFLPEDNILGPVFLRIWPIWKFGPVW